MYSKQVEESISNANASVGDEIELFDRKTGKKVHGTLMPKTEVGDPNSIVLKLSTGYNVGIKYTDQKEIHLISKKKEHTFVKPELKKKRSLPKVVMIYTGGTIGSKVDYVTGGVYMLTKPEELLGAVPELADIADIEVMPLMSIASEDMGHEEWKKIASAVVDATKMNAHGVVITHGTDTMHYTAAALSFMLHDLNIPVVITGSQRSTDRGSSDGFLNLASAVRVAAQSDIAEVCICMHADSSDLKCSVIRGVKARKMHTSRRDAFKAINSLPICYVYSNGEFEYVGKYRKKTQNGKQTSAFTNMEPKVAMLKAYPNSDPEIIDYYLSKGYKAIVIEGTGLGHAPTSTADESHSWSKKVKKFCEAGGIVAMTSQCVYGRVNSMVYRNLRLISSAGAIHCEDMLAEVAYVKLCYLLGNFSVKQAKEMLVKDITGEITLRSEIDSFM